MTNSYVVVDDTFRSLIESGAELQKLADGCIWAEGPVWIPNESALVWSDVRSNREWRWTAAGGASVFREPSNHANGHTLDRNGNIITCEHSSNSVTRREADGTYTTLVKEYRGGRFNSPNDVVVKSDGTIWFTDPPYGILSNSEGFKRDSEIGANYVYRLDPESGEVTIAADQFDRPNGLTFSPDESILYIADTGEPRNIRMMDVGDDGSLSNLRFFAAPEPPASDGLRVDQFGNIWTSAGDGVQVFSSEGVLLGRIPVPEKTANCEFGGENGTTLFITASTSLYSIETRVIDARRA
ncbi:MAG: SMP-30/gluconolactonase/LRE family protein [Chloroflexi bacterium]|nr:SMP-30/gluconolactonase/LRE family protein [Chloroflexota bacterium]